MEILKVLKEMCLLYCCFHWLVNILKALFNTVLNKFVPKGLIRLRLLFLSHLQRNAVVVESVLLRASLPLIHTNAIDLLTNLITRYVNNVKMS